MHDIVDLTRKFTRIVENDRDLNSIHLHMEDEVAELKAEIDNGSTGADGIVGEAIDVILCALDMIFVHRPDITAREIHEIAHRKALKWASRYGKLDRPVPAEAPEVLTGMRLDDLKAMGFARDNLATAIMVYFRHHRHEILTKDGTTYFRWLDGTLEPLNGLYEAVSGWYPAANGGYLPVRNFHLFRHGVVVLTRPAT